MTNYLNIYIVKSDGNVGIVESRIFANLPITTELMDKGEYLWGVIFC